MKLFTIGFAHKNAGTTTSGLLGAFVVLLLAAGTGLLLKRHGSAKQQAQA